MTCHQFRKGATNCLVLVGLLLALPVTSHAEEAAATEAETAAASTASIGTDPSQARVAGTTADGAPPLTIRTSKENWEFGFHGYLRAPMRMSFDTQPVSQFRTNPATGEPAEDADGNEIMDRKEDDWVFHMPPANPDITYTDWKYSNIAGGPWAEMVFSYGNAIAVGNVSIGSWNITDSSWRNLQSQLGIDQAFVTLNFPRAFGRLGGLAWNVGIFANRYGSAGRYDAGKYDTYIIGRTHIAGETLTAKLDVAEKLTIVLEHGFGAKTDTLRGNPKQSVDPGGNTGNTFGWVPYSGQNGQMPAMVNHVHGGLLFHTHKLFKELMINGHFMHAFTNSADQNDEADTVRQLDGKMMIPGVELKANGAVWGDTYVGFSSCKTDGLSEMPDAIELLHSQGGWSYLKNFYGDLVLGSTPTDNTRDAEPNPGKGVVNTIAWQYMFSIARLVWYLNGKEFWGQGPDLQLSFWGMLNLVDPDNKLEPYLRKFAKKKLKFGTEALYTPIQYMGFGVRFDRIIPDLDYDGTDPSYQTTLPSYAPFSVITPRLVFKTAFVTHEEVNITYSRYFWEDSKNGIKGRGEVRSENPYEGDNADRNTLMISVNMWW